VRPRTPEELSDLLTGELAWRKKELIALHSLLTKKTGTQFEEPLIRAGLALLYAHWEGFVRVAGGAYLTYVVSKRLRYGDLATNFVAHWARSRLERHRGPAPLDECREVVRVLREGLEEISSLPSRSELTARGNLNTDVLRNILDVLGLDYSHYQTKEKLLDESLLGSRNEIAHGRHLEMSLGGYMELHAEIISLITLFANQVENAVETKRYRRIAVGRPFAVAAAPEI
jgi:MAE_28990/MAE_18760-like HEPN